MRKVKFTQAAFEERLDAILTQFPVMDVSRSFQWAHVLGAQLSGCRRTFIPSSRVS